MEVGMMNIQLELDLREVCLQDKKLQEMQTQIEFCIESFGKVRRKLFAEVSELKKICLDVKQENLLLKEKIRELTNKKKDWTYFQGDNLFYLDHDEAIG